MNYKNVLWYALPLIMLGLLLCVALLGYFGVNEGVLLEGGGDVVVMDRTLFYLNTINYLLFLIIMFGIGWIMLFLDRKGFKF